MAHFKKHFTLDEARAALPTLRHRFGSIHRSRDQLQKLDAVLAKKLKKTGGDLGGAQVEAMMHALSSIQNDMLTITGMGIVVKDIDRGLVDFPHLRKGTEVFLCWELEEDDIGFWHDLDTGFPGREKL